MQVKTCPAQIKAAGPIDSLDEGVVEAVVATYDVDSVGDRIIPGAFAESLEEWRKSGNHMPFIWSHKTDDPDAYIGVVEHAEEVPGVGLKVRARIDMDDPKAAKAYRLMKGRRVTNFSFSYDEIDARPAPKDDSGAVKDLHKLKIYECGPTLIGCNQRTTLLSAKTATETPETSESPVIVDEPEEKADIDVAAQLADMLIKAGWQPPISPELVDALDASEKALDSALEVARKTPPVFTPRAIRSRLRRLQQQVQAIVDVIDNHTSDDSKAMPGQPASAPADPEAKSEKPAAGAAAPSHLLTERLALLAAEADLIALSQETH